MQGTVTSLESLNTIYISSQHQATLDKLHVLMQRFPRVITDMNALESGYLEWQATSDDEFPAYFDEDDKPMRTDHIWHQIS